MTIEKTHYNRFYRAMFLLGIVFLGSAFVSFAASLNGWPGPLLILMFLSLAVAVRGTTHFKGLSFTLCVLATVTATMFYPEWFISWGGFELKKLIVPVIQLIMFGMGTTLCLGDFTRVLKMPRAILIGMILQFTVMPIAGMLLAKSLGLETMVAVGVILVGSCPGGVASNVITYLARGSVALSVTMTACSTLLSPLMTPFMMKLLAQQYTHIDFAAMMLSIIKMIILPIAAGLIANKLLHKYSQWRDRILPIFSMAGLCFSIAIITALSRDLLLTAGILLFSAAVIHNAVGYVLGYMGAKLAKMEEVACRTIAIEVGLQNGGMASGIAINVLDSAKAALAPAIFGAWMNVSGSLLASIWGRKPAADNKKGVVPTSRSDIYYWKCDNPLPTKEKLLYNRKYEIADISDLVRQIGIDYFGDPRLSVTSANGEGNHYTYILKTDGQAFFFRADDGKTDDDYMEAEGAAMSLVRRCGVCVPEVYHCDVSLRKYPIRFQIMELVPGKCLNQYYQEQILNKRKIGIQLGQMLARMHAIKLDGFGFFNTRLLRHEDRIEGLDQSNKAYFFKRLDSHLKCLCDTEFLSRKQTDEIEMLLEKHSEMLELERGSVVHKDIAFWNLIGTESRIHAIIDWDDVIIGDPADDLSVLRCFYDEEVLTPVYEGYAEIAEVTDLFRAKTSLYLVRNMLWKAVIRTIMQYYENPEVFILHNRRHEKTLKELTYDRLYMGIEELRHL